MKLSDLILHVGDEHVTVQNLIGDTTNFSQGKKDAKITFVTSKENGQKVASALMGETPDIVGMVLWMPRDRLPESMR